MVRVRVDSPDSPTSTESESVLSKDQILVAISELQNSTNCFDSLAKIERFAPDSEENRDFLDRTECFVPVLVGFLDNGNGGVEFLEQVVTALDLVVGKMEDCEGLKNLTLKRHSEREKQSVDSLLLLLQHGSRAINIATARVLKSVAVDAESKMLLAEKDGLVPELLNLISALFGVTLSNTGTGQPIPISAIAEPTLRCTSVMAHSSLLLPDPKHNFIKEVYSTIETLGYISPCIRRHEM